jgi:putative transposase
MVFFEAVLPFRNAADCCATVSWIRLFCARALKEALQRYGKPEIFNTDQTDHGSQYTIKDFTDILKDNGIDISMDGRSRALDIVFVERL